MAHGKVKVQRLWRNTDFQEEPIHSTYLWYIRKFDVASKIEDTVKLGLDFDPIERFNVGLEYTYKNNDYKDPLLPAGKATRATNTMWMPLMRSPTSSS